MAPTFNVEDSQLIANLHTLSNASPKLVRSSTYPTPADKDITIRSWKMNEFKYYDIPSPFPTLARGLFTVELPPQLGASAEEKKEKAYRIVARGYDKFFNIGEVPWTTWSSLESHTSAPYTLSLKSNGCIIFIAALTPTKLVITSKHSVGPVAGSSVSHAQAGEAWLRKYMEQKGKTEADLAGKLWENNWTAIAELCDDSFEEHVLGYSPEKTGLHLHGLNVSTKAFDTLPHSTVDAFAEEWGFIKTPSIELPSIAEVQAFTTKVSDEGEWNGEAVEGFVVRTHVTEPPTGQGKDKDKSPYKPGSSFFFKVKFDEPYMMYRDWREVTKKLLSVREDLSPSILPKNKLKRAETRVYVRWVIDEIKRDRKPFAEYTKGKGIIATRERFLSYLETAAGKEEMERVKGSGEVSVTVTTGKAEGEHKKWGKTIIVPVAIPGCGKTAVAVALAHIFGFGHTQSDDVMAKKAAPQFIKNVTALLKTRDVVIADKNNHLIQHRTALRTIPSSSSPTRLLALNWGVGTLPQATVHRVCGDRITLRGANHQTLRPDAQKAHEEVVWSFLNMREELTDSEVDAVIDMDVEEDLETAVRRAVKGCVEVLGVPQPSEGEIQEALEMVGKYKPSVTKPDEKKKDGEKGKGKGGPRYYGLLTELDLEDVLGTHFSALANAPGLQGEAASFYAELRGAGRVVKRPHVTIVHKNALTAPAEQKLWDQCAALHTLPAPPLFRARLRHLLWNGRVMALVVDGLEVEGSGKEGEEFLAGMRKEARERLHITVGTQATGIAAVEAKGLVEAWRVGKTSDEQGEFKVIELDGVDARGRIKALFG